MSRRTALVRSIVTVLVSLALLAPSSAVAARPAVTAHPSVTSADVGDSFTVRGSVTRVPTGTAVRLQQVDGGRWALVAKSVVRRAGKFKFRSTVVEGVTTYRVKVARTAKTRAATSPSFTVTGVPVLTLEEVRALILQETNDFRASQGLPPLAPMAALDSVAQDWTVHMATTGDFSHNPSYAAQYPPGWTQAAENIARGPTPQEVVDAWIASPGHRANLLGSFTQLGVGYAVDAGGRPYYTQNFATYP